MSNFPFSSLKDFYSNALLQDVVRSKPKTFCSENIVPLRVLEVVHFFSRTVEFVQQVF